MPDKDYYIFLGNFGSGKTELALHFAIEHAGKGKSVSLVDLDIVNPYFRAAERRQDLAEAGIRLIAPNYATANVEIITINPEIYSVFAGGEGTVIFDVGGDNVGSRALGQYKAYFDRLPPERLQVFLVVNSHRPLSATAERSLSLMRMIEDSSRLRISELINNANLSYETKSEDLLSGYEVISELSKQCGVPVAYTSGAEEVLQGFLDIAQEQGLDQRFIGRPLPIKTRMRRDWDSFVKLGL